MHNAPQHGNKNNNNGDGAACGAVSPTGDSSFKGNAEQSHNMMEKGSTSNKLKWT